MQNHFDTLASYTAWRTPAGLVSYRDLEDRVRAYAGLWQELGVRAGEHWAVCGWSALDTFALFLASLWQDVVLFPLPDRLPESQQQLMLDQVPLQGCLERAHQNGARFREGPIHWDEEALAVGIFTSGSTGRPKAILHSWRSLRASALATNQFYGLGPEDAWLLSLDPAHIGGLQIAMRCFLGGAVTWHLAEPKALAEVLREQNPSFISLVPTQLYRLLEDARTCEQLRSCKAIVLGGAAASQELLQKAIQSGLPVSVSYGSSETAAQCTALPPGTMPQRAGDVGELLPGWDYQHSGETLRLRGAAAAAGYYQEKTFHALQDADGWMTLPDRIRHDQGRLTVLGRVDGLFQVAGENVAPLDIVRPLESLRHTADFLALPWQDAEYGTIPVLIVRSPGMPDVEGIVQRLQESLSGVQRPRRIYWHRSDEISKPARGYYEKALEGHELTLLWRQDLGRV